MHASLPLELWPPSLSRSSAKPCSARYPGIESSRRNLHASFVQDYKFSRRGSRWNEKLNKSWELDSEPRIQFTRHLIIRNLKFSPDILLDPKALRDLIRKVSELKACKVWYVFVSSSFQPNHVGTLWQSFSLSESRSWRIWGGLNFQSYQVVVILISLLVDMYCGFLKQFSEYSRCRNSYSRHSLLPRVTDLALNSDLDPRWPRKLELSPFKYLCSLDLRNLWGWLVWLWRDVVSILVKRPNSHCWAWAGCW